MTTNCATCEGWQSTFIFLIVRGHLPCPNSTAFVNFWMIFLLSTTIWPLSSLVMSTFRNSVSAAYVSLEGFQQILDAFIHLFALGSIKTAVSESYIYGCLSAEGHTNTHFRVT